MRDENLELKDACSFPRMCGVVFEAGTYDVNKAREKQLAGPIHRRSFHVNVNVNGHS